TQAHQNVPNSPANTDTNSTAILDVIRSARNPVTNVFTNTSAEGISTAMTSGSRKIRSTCWMTKNSSHQKTTPCLNDHSNICFPVYGLLPVISRCTSKCLLCDPRSYR